MLKTILFCAILAYLSGVEARRRDYTPSDRETTTPEYGAPQRVRNRYGLRNVDANNTETETTTPEYGAPQRQRKGERNFDGNGPTSWTNANGHEFYKYDGDVWYYTGDDLTYTLKYIYKYINGDFEIVLVGEDGRYVLLSEDGVYESWQFDGWYTWIANGYFTFRAQRRESPEETTTPEYSVRRRLRQKGRNVEGVTETTTPEYGAPQRQKGGRNFDGNGPTSWTNINGYVYKKLFGDQWDYTDPEDHLTYTLIEIYMVDDYAWEIVLKDSNGRYVLLTEDGVYESWELNGWYTWIAYGSFTFRKQRRENPEETTTPEYSVRRRFRYRGRNVEGDNTETTTPEYSVRRRSGYTGNDEETTTPEYSVRRRGSRRGRNGEETTTPEYSVRRLAIKRG